VVPGASVLASVSGEAHTSSDVLGPSLIAGQRRGGTGWLEYMLVLERCCLVFEEAYTSHSVLGSPLMVLRGRHNIAA
jgi:hypothetical protein